MDSCGLPLDPIVCNNTNAIPPDEPQGIPRRATGPAKGVKALAENEQLSFLDFLIERQYLKGPHVDTVRMLQKSRFFFGVLSLRKEYITIDQLEDVLNHQATTNFERKVGEIMLEKGFMSREQVDEVLSMQNASAEHQAELVVDIGLMDADKLEQALKEYKKLLSA